jgi:hypothetical protein
LVLLTKRIEELRNWGIKRFEILDCRLKHGNYKSQNPNNKQITMTEIQNSKPPYHFKKRETPICLGH